MVALSRTSLSLRSVSSVPDTRQTILDLGFSEKQAEKIQSMRCPPHKTPNINELCLTGLSHSRILRILEERPDLLKITATELRARVHTLRVLGLGEGTLQNSLFRCPALLSLSRSRVLAVTQLLKAKCQFTTQHVQKILKTAPETMAQDPNQLEEVFQYIYFRMGGKHGEMISSQVFQVSFNEIKVRHQFLERLGKFQPPDKKRVCPPSNPKLKDVIQISEEDFLSRVARSSPEELGTFRKLLEREERENEQNMEDTDDELSNDDDEQDSGSDDDEQDSESDDDEQDSESEDDSGDEDSKEDVYSDKHKPGHHYKKKI